jgi:hypothetical protein
MEFISQKPDLVALEELIDNAQNSFERIGNALKTIREQELYKPTYCSFNKYTKERWDMQRRYADRLIQSAEVMLLLRENNCSQLPTCESQVRPLTKLKKEQQLSAWQGILKKEKEGQKITAKLISQVAKEIEHQNKPEQSGSLRLTSSEKKIWKSLENLEQVPIGKLREFIFSNNGEVLEMPAKVTHLLKTLRMLELEHNYDVSLAIDS